LNLTRLSEFCSRHYAALAVGVLALAAVNLTFRLGREFVTEWDESLYAISAWEMLESREWIGFTFLGTLDYYNTKPPLNIWLIALAFEAFGRSLVSLRLASVLSAWLTVAVLEEWTRRMFGPPVALIAGVVLATTFGFLHVHSGRSANTDALFTLLVLLTVVTLWAEENRPWRRLWLGPVMAATFLLRGFGVLMPLVIVAVMDVWKGRRQAHRFIPTGIALVLFLVPVAAWLVARYQVDKWRFLERMFQNDFLAISLTVTDGHAGGPFYYATILLKHHYDWLLAGLVALALFPIPWSRLRLWVLLRPTGDGLKVLLAAWAASALIIPTLMRTKLPWYLNTFYPLFALATARLLAHGFSRATSALGTRRRLVALSLVTALALGVAEGKLVWYSLRYRDLSLSAQGLLLAEGDRLAGHRVYRDRLDLSALFVARLVGADLRHASSFDEFLRDSRPGDFLLLSQRGHHHHELVLVGSSNGHRLYLRRERKKRG